MKYEIKTTVAVPAERVCNLLVSAFESSSGSCYWAHWVDKKSGPTYDDGLVWYGHTSFWEADDYSFEIEFDNPDSDGCVTKLITPKEVQAGLEVMNQKYPRHFINMMKEEDDAITGDVLLQCIVLGDVIYG